MAKLQIRESVHSIRETCRVRIYPGGIVELMAASRPIFGRAGWEAVDGPKAAPRRKDAAESGVQEDKGALERSIRRARARVRDIALANGFEYFVTLTLAPEAVDRYDDRAVVRKLSTWADNEARRCGLRYVLVPERHKDGAIHFHGFAAWDRAPGPVWVDSGTVRRPGIKKPCRPADAEQRAAWLAEGGQVVYNAPRWRLGYSTALHVYGDYLAAVGYCCKYIGKDLGREGGGRIGGRWYYSGGALHEPRTEYVPMSVDDVLSLPGAHAFSVDQAGLGMAVWRGRQADLEGGDMLSVFDAEG